MRVIHLINAFNRGGVEKWLLSVLATAPRDRLAIDVCCKGSDLGPWACLAMDCGASIHHCRLTPFQVGFVRGLIKTLRENRYDVIHNHLGVYSGLAVWVARRVGIPVVTTFHSSEFPAANKALSLPGLVHLRSLYGRFSLGYAIRHSDMLTAVSRGVIEEVVPNRPELRAKTVVTHLGVDIPEPATKDDKARFREELGWAEDTPLVCHVGRFFEQKNHFGLLAMFERVLRQAPGAKLVLVGDGPLKEPVEDYVKTRNLQESVRFLGSRDDAVSVMACCDVFAFPSFWEGFGIVALEANSVCVPVVGSDVVGTNEAVENGKTALLFETSDLDSMAAAVVRLINDRAYAASLGSAGRARAKELFSMQASVEGLMRVYERAVAGRARG